MFFSKKLPQLKKGRGEIEPQDIFLDSLVKKREENLIKIEVPLQRKRIIFFFFLVLVFLGLILSRLFFLQIFAYQKFQELARENQFIYQSITSQRGIIYDANFVPLVFNKQVFNLVCQRNILQERPYYLEQLSSFLDFRSQDILKKLEDSQNENILVKKNLNYQEVIRFEGTQENFSGCWLQKETEREYPFGPLLSHVLGYWRRNGPSDGLEKFYDKILQSQEGKIIIERDARGRIISQKVERDPQPGDSLVLWLDKELQEKLYFELSKKLEELHLKKAAAVAIDPNTGGVLALVSLPTFDNNLFARGLSQEEWEKIKNDKTYPLLNRVIGGKYPPGSTIKPLIASAALQEKIISSKTIVNCKGEIVIENPYFKDRPFIFRDWKIHGRVEVKKAIAESCNVFFYLVGGGYKNFKGLGVDLINKYLELFGWKEKLGIDLPGEKPGFVPTREWKKEKFDSPLNIWFPGDTYNLSIGQGYLRVTPLEVAVSFGAIANGGKLFQPRMVKAIVDKDKNVVKEFQPKVIRENFIDEKNLKIVREGMREAVVYGSAVILSDLPIKTAAKTGTAQLGKKGYYHNWVTVFAPYDHPQIVLTIIVEEVPGIHLTSLPVAKEVLKWYFSEKENITL